jgi:hypothetical protein
MPCGAGGCGAGLIADAAGSSADTIGSGADALGGSAGTVVSSAGTSGTSAGGAVRFDAEVRFHVEAIRSDVDDGAFVGAAVVGFGGADAPRTGSGRVAGSMPAGTGELAAGGPVTSWANGPAASGAGAGLVGWEGARLSSCCVAR